MLDSPLSVSRYADLIVRGGWPGWIDLQGDQARPLVDAYLAALQQRDFPLVAGNRRAPRAFLPSSSRICLPDRTPDATVNSGEAARG